MFQEGLVLSILQKAFRWPSGTGVAECLFFAIKCRVLFLEFYAQSQVKKRIWADLSFFLAHLMIMAFTRRDSFLYVLSLHVLLSFTCACILKKGFGLERMYAIFLGFALVLITGVGKHQISGLRLSGWNLPGLGQQGTFMEVLEDLVIGLGCILLLKRFFLCIDRQRTIHARELFAGIFPPFAMFATRIAIYHFTHFLRGSMTPKAEEVLGWISAFLFFSTLVSLAASEMYFAYQRMRMELQKAQEQLRLQYDLFEERRQGDEKVRSLYHDMANHLDTIKAMAGTKEVQAYIEDLEESVHSPLADVHTGNSTLDILLRQKAEECARAGLRLEAPVSFPHGDILTPMEICTLFSNCLDNAIWAASDPQVVDKCIRVGGSEQHGCFLASFENAYAGSLKRRAGRWESTKEGEGHGYGLKNVEQVVHSHDGSLDIQEEAGRFRLTILIPLGEPYPPAAGSE